MLYSSLPQPTFTLPAMRRLDRFGWSSGIAFISYGTSIGVRVDEPAVMERLLPSLPPDWKPAPSPLVDYLFSLRVHGSGKRAGRRGPYRLYGGPDLLVSTPDLEEVCRELEGYLDWTVAFSARQWLFVHAGVVGVNGRAILLPGRSFSGKTSLVAALIRAGAAYYSDEYAVLDAEGQVHPYPKRLNLRGPDGTRVDQPTAEQLGGHTGTQPLPVGLIALTEYQAGARWRPRRLSPGEAVLSLLDNTLLARYQPGRVLPILQRAATQAVAVKGRRGAAEAMVDSLCSYLTRH